MTAEIRDIGIDVASPKMECNDPNCPFHGSLPVRGQVIDGVVATVKMNASPCLGLKVGDKVRIAECRPLSKTVSFVVIEKVE